MTFVAPAPRRDWRARRGAAAAGLPHLVAPTGPPGAHRAPELDQRVLLLGAVAVFTGILAGLAIYFFTYSGYDNAHHWKDRITAVIAGTAAIGVACFPTIAPAPPLELPWWHPYLGTIHFYCATALFGGFIVFVLLPFPQSGAVTRTGLPRRRRETSSTMRAA